MLRKILLIAGIIISGVGAAALSAFSVWELRNVFSGNAPDFIHVFSLIGSMKKRIAEFQKITKTDDISAFYDDIKLPLRSTSHSAGYDFFLPYDIVIKPNETVKILTGIRAKMEDNYVLMIFPRSSLGIKHKLTLDNTVAIIDADYYNALNEGHIMLSLTNYSDHIVSLNKGDRFVQGIFVEYGITYDDDVDKERVGGIGSTNI